MLRGFTKEANIREGEWFEVQGLNGFNDLSRKGAIQVLEFAAFAEGLGMHPIGFTDLRPRGRQWDDRGDGGFGGINPFDGGDRGVRSGIHDHAQMAMDAAAATGVDRSRVFVDGVTKLANIVIGRFAINFGGVGGKRLKEIVRR